MKEKLLKEVKKLLENKELTREEVLLELFTDDDGDLYLSELDFSNFEGGVFMSELKVKNNLYQYNHFVEGNLYQSYQKVKGDLYQNVHHVKGGLYQSLHHVEGNYSATNIKVKGEIDFEVPKKITLQEPKEMGYELEERK